VLTSEQKVCLSFYTSVAFLCVPRHFNNENAVPMRSGSFSTMGTAFPRVRRSPSKWPLTASHVRWKSGNRPILVQDSVSVKKWFMDPVKVPLTKISRTVNKISIEFSANPDKIVIITFCVWSMLVFSCYFRLLSNQELCLMLRPAYVLLLVKLN